MQIVFATVAMFWWIAIWGLSGIFTEEWTNEQKIKLYISMIIGVLITIWIFPSIVNKI